MSRRKMAAGITLATVFGAGWGIAARCNGRAEKRTQIVIPGRLIRGAWQHPDALRTIIARERIKTIVT